MKQKKLVVIVLLISLLCTSFTNVNFAKEIASSKKDTNVALAASKDKISYDTYQFDATQKFQEIDGFGAAYTWYADQIFNLKKADQTALLDKLFLDSKMTVLRFKNEYEYNKEDEAPNANTMARIYNEAKVRAAKFGEKVIVLMCCWSPPPKLKGEGNVTGKASLKKDSNGKFVYEDYAKWWAESIKYYESKGIDVNYVSIQNECDFKAEYDGCTFETKETDVSPSYAKAYLATYHEFKTEFGNDAPKMIGPETMSCVPETLNNYMQDVMNTEPESIYAIAHHLYVGTTASDKDNSVKPDSTLVNFSKYKKYFSKYKVWQTEYYFGHAVDAATLINNCMTLTNANCYIFWSGVWNDMNKPVKFDDVMMAGLEGSNGGARYNIKAGYYAMRHFSEFVRPGYTRIQAPSGGNLRSSAYISKDGKKLALVLINRSVNNQSIQLDGIGYKIKKSNVYQSVVSDTDSSKNYLYQKVASLGKKNTITLPGESITTIDITGSTK